MAHALRLRAGAARIRRRLASRLSSAGEARPPGLGASAAITLRLADRGDQPAIERLAELTSRATPSGPYLVADVDGQLWAALPLSSGEPVADPFRTALEVKALLSLRAAQLDANEAARPHEESATPVPLLSPEGRAC